MADELELPDLAARSPADFAPGTLYAIADRWVRKGDVLVMENVEVEDPERPGETKLTSRIAARFYGFSPTGHPVDDPACPDNVAPLMAYMFETMSNDGFEAAKAHLRQGEIILLNPRDGLIRPEGL